MITSTALNAGTVLQTSGGSGGGISMGLLLVIGVAAIILIALVWMLTNKGSSSD